MTAFEKFNLNTVAGILCCMCLTAWLGVGVRWWQEPPFEKPPVTLKAGMVVDRFMETVEGDRTCYVVLAGKTKDGLYRKRTLQVNCAVWRHDLKVGAWWQAN